MRDRVYLLGGLRSHIGIRYGIFKMVRPEVLGGEILHRVWSKYGKSALPDLVLCGNAVGPSGVDVGLGIGVAVTSGIDVGIGVASI